MTILGLLIVSLSYLGFSVSTTVSSLFFFYSLAGAGFGIASPAKNSLFSEHLNRNKEAEEWSLYDALSLLSMAAATALGGFIAKDYGFRTLFYVSTFISIMGVFPYLLYFHHRETSIAH